MAKAAKRILRPAPELGARAWRYLEPLDVGIIGCNSPVPTSATAPLDGVKQGGLGRDGGHLGLKEFQVTRTVGWQM